MARGNRRARAPRRASRERRTVIAVAVAVLAAAVVGYFAYRAQANLPGAQFADQGNLHVASPDLPHEQYNSDPPTSGPHLPYIAPWGVHTRSIVRELQVHNLEDGGVVVQYNCDCPDLVAKLKAMGHVVTGIRQGDAHSIRVDLKTGEYQGGADRRIDGMVSGY